MEGRENCSWSDQWKCRKCNSRTLVAGDMNVHQTGFHVHLVLHDWRKQDGSILDKLLAIASRRSSRWGPQTMVMYVCRHVCTALLMPSCYHEHPATTRTDRNVESRCVHRRPHPQPQSSSPSSPRAPVPAGNHSAGDSVVGRGVKGKSHGPAVSRVLVHHCTEAARGCAGWCFLGWAGFMHDLTRLSQPADLVGWPMR